MQCGCMCIPCLVNGRQCAACNDGGTAAIRVQVLHASMCSPMPGSVYNVVDDDPANRQEATLHAVGCHFLFWSDRVPDEEQLRQWAEYTCQCRAEVMDFARRLLFEQRGGEAAKHESNSDAAVSVDSSDMDAVDLRGIASRGRTAPL
jgi:hypothetical protein